jgi:5-methyltetrahydrofolate--homocysteine methyltransferase
LGLPRLNGQRDNIAISVETAGEGGRERDEKARNEASTSKSPRLLTAARETAEACAEWLRQCIREDWGFSNPTEITMV